MNIRTLVILAGVLGLAGIKLLNVPGAGTIVVVALFTWTMIRARTMTPRSPLLVRLSTLALVLLIAQVFVGGANVLTELATWARATHVAMSALITASLR
jgi:heme A synthase